jgi:capsular polysaccharide export protein
MVRMEDGFIRSRGLGSDFFGALSVVLDDLGVYYDATGPSRLETLIETGRPDATALIRAAALRDRIVEAGLSKYNLKGEPPAGWPTDRERLLVVGQVENDRSIRLGCTDIRTNSGLVEAARRDFPDAFLIYRNHPDVTAGNRPGLLDAGAMDAVDAVADDLDIIDCLNACDRLVTLTSLSGFEALMRGKAVTTYGRPFYAGWGLTDDRTGPFERRGRKRVAGRPDARDPDRLSALRHPDGLALRGRGPGRGPDRRARYAPARPAARPDQALVERR